MVAPVSPEKQKNIKGKTKSVPYLFFARWCKTQSSPLSTPLMFSTSTSNTPQGLHMSGLSSLCLHVINRVSMDFYLVLSSSLSPCTIWGRLRCAAASPSPLYNRIMIFWQLHIKTFLFEDLQASTTSGRKSWNCWNPYKDLFQLESFPKWVMVW